MLIMHNVQPGAKKTKSKSSKSGTKTKDEPKSKPENDVKDKHDAKSKSESKDMGDAQGKHELERGKGNEEVKSKVGATHQRKHDAPHQHDDDDAMHQRDDGDAKHKRDVKDRGDAKGAKGASGVKDNANDKREVKSKHNSNGKHNSKGKGVARPEDEGDAKRKGVGYGKGIRGGSAQVRIHASFYSYAVTDGLQAADDDSDIEMVDGTRAASKPVSAVSRTSSSKFSSSGKKSTTNNLPDGAQDHNRWSSAFVPTLLRYQGSRHNPWTWDARGSVPVIQKIWDVVYGDSLPHRVVAGDNVHKVVRSSTSSCSLKPSTNLRLRLHNESMIGAAAWPPLLCLSSRLASTPHPLLTSARSSLKMENRMGIYRLE